MGFFLLRSTASGGGGSEVGDVDLTQLPTSAGPDITAYTALDVDGMSAGTSFNDPVTNVLTVKVTDSATPEALHWCNEYSTLGLQISQAWGANGDQYTLWFMSINGVVYLVDYQLGGTLSNYRAGPGGESRIAFSRLPGEERILYVKSTTQLRRYNTATDSYADTGSFPYSWNQAAGDSTTWLQVAQDGSWATAQNSGHTNATAMRFSDGTVITQATGGNDEMYSGYGDVAFVNDGASSFLWDLTNNTTEAMPSTGSLAPPFHVASLNGYWCWIDSNTGGGVMPILRLSEDGTLNTSVNQTGYWGQLHCSGHWTQPAGTDQWMLVSNWDNNGGWTSTLRYAIYFLNIGSGTKRILGHSYTDSQQIVSGTRPNGSNNYFSQPHATQSTDGKLVMFTGNMLDSPRTDVFLMEVPRA